MPFELPLPNPFRRYGWKVKIRDRERLEPPHITIFHKTKTWRIELRRVVFLDGEPDPRDVPPEILEFVQAHLNEFRGAWDSMYPANPVTREGSDD